MLGKLLKHEWNATYKLLLIINSAVILLALLGKLSLSTIIFRDRFPVVWILLIIAYVLSLFIVPLITFFYLAVRFYKNLFGNEGYLSFTLPVKVWELLLCKLIYFFAWTLITIILCCISGLILIAGEGILPALIDVWPELTASFYSEIGYSLNGFLIWMAIFVVLGAVQNILHVFVSVAVGHNIGKHRVLSCVIVYLILYAATSLASFIISFAAGIFTSGGLNSFFQAQMTGTTFYMIIAATFFMTLLLSIIYYIVTLLFMKTKLNLE